MLAPPAPGDRLTFTAHGYRAADEAINLLGLCAGPIPTLLKHLEIVKRTGNFPSESHRAEALEIKAPEESRPPCLPGKQPQETRDSFLRMFHQFRWVRLAQLNMEMDAFSWSNIVDLTSHCDITAWVQVTTELLSCLNQSISPVKLISRRELHLNQCIHDTIQKSTELTSITISEVCAPERKVTSPTLLNYVLLHLPELHTAEATPPPPSNRI